MIRFLALLVIARSAALYSKERDDEAISKPEITKAKKLLDWEPKIDLEQGLKKTIDWFKKENTGIPDTSQIEHYSSIHSQIKEI